MVLIARTSMVTSKDPISENPEKLRRWRKGYNVYMRYLLLSVVYLVCLPVDLLACVLLLLLRLIYGGEFKVDKGVLILLSKKRFPFFAGITLGHAMIIEGEYADDEGLLRHELVHVEQFEGTAFTGALLAVLCGFLGLRWSILAFLYLPWIHYYANSAVAWLCGRPVYRGNVLEKSARAIVADSTSGDL